MLARSFGDIAELPGSPRAAYVYEHGWQSWSPSGLYRADTQSPRPMRELWQKMAFRPEKPAPKDCFQGEGLLGVLNEEGFHVWSLPRVDGDVPSIRARSEGDRLVISADGPTEHALFGPDVPQALGRWCHGVVERMNLDLPLPLPAAWCSWYAYWGAVTGEDVLENLAAIDRLDLDIGIIQVDDGHQAEIGDWVDCSERFGPRKRIANRIVDSGRRAGIWTAPFMVGSRSTVAATKPGWLVEGAIAGHHWDQELGVLDVTHPLAAEHLYEVFHRLRSEGFTFFKIDFLYAGAMEGGRSVDSSGVDAYREGMRIIRSAVGDDATILGCGAPLFPSVGLVDAMRVSPDIDPSFEPVEGDISQPSMRSALWSGRARSWMHGRFWVNDPDCILVRAENERREEWADYLDGYGALMTSSDPLGTLDARGLELTRRLLRPSGTRPIEWDAFVEPDQGNDLGPGSSGGLTYD